MNDNSIWMYNGAYKNSKRAYWQNIFRKHYNNIDHLVTLQVLMEESALRGKGLYCCFINFKKLIIWCLRRRTRTRSSGTEVKGEASRRKGGLTRPHLPMEVYTRGAHRSPFAPLILCRSYSSCRRRPTKGSGRPNLLVAAVQSLLSFQ